MQTIFWILVYSVAFALWVAFVLLLAYKVGIVEWMQVHGNELVSKMAHCDFCMSWWLNIFFSLFALGFTGNLMFLVVPFLSTPLARRLL